MRINPYPMPDLLTALSEVQQQEQTAQMQIATGRRVNSPSDDPAAAALLVQNHDLSSQADSYQRSMSSVNGEMQTADSTIGSMVTVLQRAITLGVQGANGTLSDSNRAAVVVELQGIQAQLISMANVSYQGTYIFGGTAQTKPYTADSSQPSGVRYDGNSGTNQISIGQNYQLQVNLPGTQIFSAPAADMFKAVNDLITAIQNNTGADAAVASVGKAYDYITSQRVFYGNGMNQISAQQNFLSNEKVQLSNQETTIAGTDMAAAATTLANTETARQAALAAIAKVSKTNLFDYLT